MTKKIYHILVIDDDQKIRELLCKFLVSKDFIVSSAKNIDEAEQIISNFQFDIIIVDVMMPGEDGLSFVKRYRKNSDLPILMLTAMDDVNDRINGLLSGADDYIAKPFEPMELFLRIKNILLRIEKTEGYLVKFGKFVFNSKKRILYNGDEEIYLTSSDIELLGYFCQNINKLVTREDIAKIFYGINERSIDVQINRLRVKIEDDAKKPRYLKTIRGKGYIFCDD